MLKRILQFQYLFSFSINENKNKFPKTLLFGILLYFSAAMIWRLSTSSESPDVTMIYYFLFIALWGLNQNLNGMVYKQIPVSNPFLVGNLLFNPLFFCLSIFAVLFIFGLSIAVIINIVFASLYQISSGRINIYKNAEIDPFVINEKSILFSFFYS